MFLDFSLHVQRKIELYLLEKIERFYIFSSEPDCPSLHDADSLSQTQLVKRLTHGIEQFYYYRIV